MHQGGPEQAKAPIQWLRAPPLRRKYEITPATYCAYFGSVTCLRMASKSLGIAVSDA
jgi:hypothetical protein